MPRPQLEVTEKKRIKNKSMKGQWVYKMDVALKNLRKKSEGMIFETFLLGNTIKWQIAVCPKSRNKAKFLAIYIRQLTNPEVTASWKIGIVKETYDFESVSEDLENERFLLSSFKCGIFQGFPKFISRKSLWDDVRLFDDDGTINFTIIVHLNLTKPKFEFDQSSNDATFSLVPGHRSRTFPDLTIKVQKKSIKVHKVFLAESSPVFHDLLSEKETMKVLNLDDLEFNIAQNMVDFIYKDKVEEMLVHGKSMLRAANQYKMERLKKYCEKFFHKNLTLENALETLDLAVETVADELQSECYEFLLKKISELPEPVFFATFSAYFEKFFRHCIKKGAVKLKEHFDDEDVKEKPENLNLCQLAREMETFFGQDMYTDVEIEVGDKILKAHKSILASRSPFFNGMFLNDFLEARNSRVIITNFDYETTYELLRFIYCGNVLNLDELACNLLEAADQYLLADLMDICDESLQANLTVENILKILGVAELHNRKLLKEKAVEFLGRNIKKVMETPDWPKVIEANPQLLYRILLDWIKIFS